MNTSENDRSQNTVPIEVHFTEGFFEDVVTVSAAQETLATVTLKTRMQTGLAHVETLHLTDGEEVTLVCEERHLTSKIKVDATQPFIIVALMDGVFEIVVTDQMPGYL